MYAFTELELKFEQKFWSFYLPLITPGWPIELCFVGVLRYLLAEMRKLWRTQ
jgi:hypothetical protein